MFSNYLRNPSFIPYIGFYFYIIFEVILYWNFLVFHIIRQVFLLIVMFFCPTVFFRKKSENTKITPLKSLKKISKSPNLPKKNNQDNAGSGAKPKSVTSLQPDDVQQYLSHSAEELDNVSDTRLVTHVSTFIIKKISCSH